MKQTARHIVGYFKLTKNYNWRVLCTLQQTLLATDRDMIGRTFAAASSDANIVVQQARRITFLTTEKSQSKTTWQLTRCAFVRRLFYRTVKAIDGGKLTPPSFFRCKFSFRFYL